MKKGYIKPQMVVVELENEGMLCASNGELESGGKKPSGSAEAPSYKLPEGPDLWSDDSLW